jgi:hypothetical protein
MNYPSFAFALNKQDVFWLIWQQRLFKSTDTLQWTEAEDLSSDSGLDLQPGWDGSGEYLLTCDYADNLLLLAGYEETIKSSWGTNLGPKTALWRRNNQEKWKFLGFLAEEHIRSFCMTAANANHVAFLVDSGNEGLALRAYDDTLGWSGPRKIEDAPEYSSTNAIAAVGEGRYVAAYCGDEGIVVLTLDGVTFNFEP